MKFNKEESTKIVIMLAKYIRSEYSHVQVT